MDSNLSIFHKFGRRKKYNEKGPHPDIYRDELRDRLKNITYANQTIFIADKTKSLPVYRQLWGGLQEPIELPWNYYRSENSQKRRGVLLRRNEQCEAITFTMDTTYDPSDTRQHIRFRSSNSTAYAPIVIKPLILPSKIGSYYYNVQLTSIKPDIEFVHSVEQAVLSSLPRLKQSNIEMNALSFNPSQINMKFFTADIRDGIVRLMASIIKQQPKFYYASIENSLMLLTEGLRILLALGIGAGDKLQVLNIWNLFFFNQLPIETEKDDFHILNEFRYDPESDEAPTEQEKVSIWNVFLERTNYGTLSSVMADRYLKMALLCFETLHTLYINYSYLSKGQGAGLLQLGCLRNGVLVNLHLLTTRSDHPFNTKQKISFKAWMEALELCPNLKLHLVIVGMHGNEQFQALAASNMPLESIQILNGFSLDTGDSAFRPRGFDCVTRTLAHRYARTLKHVCFELWRPDLQVDITLAHLLKKLPLLETFEYRGQLDCVDTIFRIIQFIFDHKDLRLRRVVLALQDDPCGPKMFETVFKHINETFKEPLMTIRGVDFHLMTNKL